MLKFVADENLKNAILRGMFLRNSTLDIVRVQDIPEISGKGDPCCWNGQLAKGGC
jgi:hypothetical protein